MKSRQTPPFSNDIPLISENGFTAYLKTHSCPYHLLLSVSAAKHETTRHLYMFCTTRCLLLKVEIRNASEVLNQQSNHKIAQIVEYQDTY